MNLSRVLKRMSQIAKVHFTRRALLLKAGWAVPVILAVGLPSTVLAGMTSPSRRHDHKPKGHLLAQEKPRVRQKPRVTDKKHWSDKNYWPGKDHWFDKKHWPDD